MPYYSDDELLGLNMHKNMGKCEVDWHAEWLAVHKLIDRIEEKSGLTIEQLIDAFERGCTLKEPEE